MTQPSDVLNGPLLLSEEAWSEQRVIEFLRDQLSVKLSPLNHAEQLNYRNLFRQYSDALVEVEREHKKIKEDFERLGIRQLKQRLLEVTGIDIDPRHSYLHTRYLYIPEARSRRTPHNLEGEQHALESPAEPILDKREPVVRIVSMSLWQAACLNVGFLAYFASFRSGSLIEASYIDDQSGVEHEFARASTARIKTSLIDVKAFVDVIRELNIGNVLKQTLETEMLSHGSLSRKMRLGVRAQLQFALLELYRRAGAQPVVKDKIKKLAGVLEKRSNRLRIKK